MARFLPLTAFVAALSLSACGGPIVAVENVDHTFTTTSAPHVAVKTFNGRIDVTAGTGESVVATVKKTARGWSEEDARHHLPNVVVTFSQDGDTVTVSVDQRPFDGSFGAGADVELTVPAGALLGLASSNGDVTTHGTGAEISAQTSNGDIDLSGGTGSIQASTSNGTVRVTPSGAATVTASSSNGSLEFHGTLLDGRSTFDTSNGDVDLFVTSDSAFHLDAETSNGTASCGLPMVVTSSTSSSLHADIGTDPAGVVRVNSSNGSIRVAPLGAR